MKLIDLDPRWMTIAGEGSARVGMTFDCPHCGRIRIAVPFANPLDEAGPREGWERTGCTFETLTLRPSILQHIYDESGKVTGEHWHGYITNGEIA